MAGQVDPDRSLVGAAPQQAIARTVPLSHDAPATRTAAAVAPERPYANGVNPGIATFGRSMSTQSYAGGERSSSEASASSQVSSRPV